jgi:hypothetical protein
MESIPKKWTAEDLKLLVKLRMEIGLKFSEIARHPEMKKRRPEITREAVGGKLLLRQFCLPVQASPHSLLQKKLTHSQQRQQFLQRPSFRVYGTLLVHDLKIFQYFQKSLYLTRVFILQS